MVMVDQPTNQLEVVVGDNQVQTSTWKWQLQDGRSSCTLQLFHPATLLRLPCMYNGPCSVHNVFVFVYLCTSFRVCTFPLCIPCYLGAAVYKEAACVESKLGSSNHQKLIYCRPITAFCSQSSSSQKKTESCSFLWIIHIFPRLLSSIPFILMMVMVNWWTLKLKRCPENIIVGGRFVCLLDCLIFAFIVLFVCFLATYGGLIVGGRSQE